MKKLVLITLFLATFFPTVFSNVRIPTGISVVQATEKVVYITRTGAKYHRESCRYLSKSKIKTTQKEAVKNQYGACKVCKP